MSVTEMADFDGHEAIHHIEDAETGLRAIVVLHSTFLGPGAGGVRFWHYASDADALTDGLRLSRGMSYKNAMAGLPMGGGKAVIMADAQKTKTPEMIDAFARGIDKLGGTYVTAQDVGMSLDDMVRISATTPYVSGLPGAGGDPGPSTALGVFLGVQAASRQVLGKDSMIGVHVAIQGLGSVGGGLARHLTEAGAKLTVTDINESHARKVASDLGARFVTPDEIMTVKADIFSPCALGAILTDESIPMLDVAAVAGGANNQLARPHHAEMLAKRGILYAPDYVINAGGIINVALGYLAMGGVDERIRGIPDRLEMIWQQSSATGENPATTADRMARALIGRD